MNYSIFISLTVVFILIYLWISKKTSREMQGEEDYFLSKRNLKTFALTLTLFASQMGAGTLIGSAEAGYFKGWIGTVYPLGIFFGLIFLGLVFGPKLREMGLSTVAQIFEVRYKSKKLRQLASYLSIFPLFFILVAQIVGARKFFLAIGLESSFFFLVIWAVFLLYTVLGGLKAVVKADIFQVIFIVIFLTLAFAFKWKQTSLPYSSLAALPFSFNFSGIASLIIMTLYMGFEQDMGQKCFAAKNPNIVKRAALIAAFMVLFCSFIAVDFGVFLKASNVFLAQGEDVLMKAIITLTGPVISSFIACGILMVIFSISNSLLCAISSNLVLDLSIWKKFSFAKQTLFSRAVTALVGILGIVISFNFQNILPILLKSYEFSVAILCPSILIALFTSKVSAKAAMSSMAVGALSFVSLNENQLIPKELIVLAISFASYFLVFAVLKIRQIRKEKIKIEDYSGG